MFHVTEKWLVLLRILNFVFLKRDEIYILANWKCDENE